MPLPAILYIIASIGATATVTALSRAFQPVIIKTSKNLTYFYRSKFENRNIAIFGDSQSGKTSLLLLLTTGRPYKTGSNGEIIEPEPTNGIVIVDEGVYKNLNLKNINNRDRVSRDVNGELVDDWQEIIDQVNPHGIIYMVDARASNSEIQETIKLLFNVVIMRYRTNWRNHRLRSLHIYANFTDKINPERKDQIISLINHQCQLMGRALDLEKADYLKSIQYLISLIQLSPKETDWKEAKYALEEFGTHLREVK